MDSQTTMLQKLEALINTYSTNYTSPDAISVLQKTFQSHNITIEDWNQLLTFVQENFETLDLPGLYALLGQIIDTIQNLDVDVDCYSKAESDARFEPIINNEHKLGADLVDDTSSTHKFVTESEKTTWSGKQDALSFDLTPTLGSNNPVISGGVKSYVDEAVSNVYKFQGSKTIAQLNSLEVDSSMHGYVYNVSDSGTLSNGSVQVLAGDNVSIVYDELTSTYTWDKLAGTFTVDLTPYVTLDTAQTITAVKTFINTTVTSKIRPSNNNVSDIGESGKGYKDLYLSGKAYLNGGAKITGNIENGYDQICFALANGQTMANIKLVPMYDNTLDLGSSTNGWKDIYLSGSLRDGNNANYGYTLPDSTNLSANSELLDSASAQNIIGTKTIGNGTGTDSPFLNFSNQYATYGIKLSGYGMFVNAPFYVQGGTLTTRDIIPNSDNSKDIGQTALRYKDGYFAGQVYAENTPNVINASDIASNNVLTQAQFDLITNGKPTLVKGEITINGQIYKNQIISNYSESLTEIWFVWNVKAISTYIQQRNIVINKITKVISQTSNYGYTYYKNGSRGIQIGLINGISFPEYPSSPTIPQNFNYLTNNTLAYEKVTKYNNLYEYASNSTTELKYETINNISISADTTYTLANAPNGTYPEYKGYITNSSGSAKVITLPTSVTKIKASSSLTVVQPIVSGGSVTSAGTVSIPDGAYVEFNLQNGLIALYNWNEQ